MAAKSEQAAMVAFWTQRLAEILQMRNNLNEHGTEYLMEKVGAMRDDKLKACVAALIGWGDDERAELETFCSVALELMKDITPSRLREATKRVELRHYLTQVQNKT